MLCSIWAVTLPSFLGESIFFYWLTIFWSMVYTCASMIFLTTGIEVGHHQPQWVHLLVISYQYFSISPKKSIHPLSLTTPFLLCALCTHHVLYTVLPSTILSQPVTKWLGWVSPPPLPFKYFSNILNSPQYSSSRYLTILVRIATTVCMYLHTHVGININWYMVWWKTTAYYSGIFFLSY